MAKRAKSKREKGYQIEKITYEKGGGILTCPPKGDVGKIKKSIIRSTST